jgi:hypothetical protein
MTTCTPLKPFRCWQYRWQYRKDSTEPVPEWAKYMDKYDTHWYVEFDECYVVRYTPAEFAERFRVEEGK